MAKKQWPPATRDQAKYVAVRIGRCDPWCILPRSHLNGECLTCGQVCAQGEGDYEFVDYPLPAPSDWTCAGGRPNNSRAFNDLEDFVDGIIRQSGHDIVNGRTKSVARLIVAQLAHKMLMGGPDTMPNAVERESIRTMIDMLRVTGMHATERQHRDRVIAFLERVLK